VRTTTARARIDLYEQQAAICKVLTDPKRLMLLEALRAGDRSVGELADVLGATLPNVSQHLAVLRAAGLVESRRTGQTVRYSLAEPSILEACDIVGGIVARRQASRPLALRNPIAIQRTR
jgi:ArsR family transcriptional regulator